MADNRFIIVHELKNPATGKTWKEENLAKPHAFPLGALVELTNDDDDYPRDGVRLFVVHQYRDCDGSPLYCLAFDRKDTEVETPGFANRKWLNGIDEGAMKLIRTPK